MLLLPAVKRLSERMHTMYNVRAAHITMIHSHTAIRSHNRTLKPHTHTHVQCASNAFVYNICFNHFTCHLISKFFSFYDSYLAMYLYGHTMRDA